MSQKTQTARVEIYTWDGCPYCNRALSLLQSKNIDFQQIRLDGDEEARERMAQTTKGNRKSVPQIFIDSVSVGGCDDLMYMDSNGELDRLVFNN